MTERAAKKLKELYNQITSAYQRRPGDEKVDAHLDGVKKTLAETKRATGVEFLCFRPTKTSSSKEKEKPDKKEGTRSRRKEGEGLAAPARMKERERTVSGRSTGSRVSDGRF